jgi:glucosamine--fructose-6-phosphate aminotransferase (isomerizing)
MNTYKEVHSRGANILIITSIDNESIKLLKKQQNTKVIQIPNNSFINEILTMITIQHVCYGLACFRNINPDKPKNLAKVVTVE